MHVTDVVVVGAGQAGLAASHWLSRRNIDHVVLERGRIAERWRTQSWDSLRLLTPNWMSRLPGFAYRGPRPDGFMAIPELVAFFEHYAALGRAPVLDHTRVLAIEPAGAGFANEPGDPGYRVLTDRGEFRSRALILATGHCDVPLRPALAARVSPRIEQLTPAEYKNPSALAPGAVLVVGAAASGVQIAEELARAGRAVTLAVGRHTRMPRRYRGADIMAWLDRTGVLGETVTDADHLAASLAQPSLQLIGSQPARDLDLATLRGLGVRLCGRLVELWGTRALFADDLPRSIAAAEHRLARVLGRIDRYANVLRALGADPELAEAERPAAIDPAWFEHAPRALELRDEGFGSIVWATGYRRDYRHLKLPVLDAHGEIEQSRGITRMPGFYTLGLRHQATRKSSFIDGVAADSEYVTAHIARELGQRTSDAA